MTMEITFTATDIFDLKQQLSAFVGQFDHGSISEPLPAPPEVTAVNVLAKPKSGKKTAEKAPVAEPEPIDDEVEAMDDTEFVTGSTATQIAEKLKVKDETMAILQQAYADGKIDKLRKILKQFGNGATSFPEIEPTAFPKIAAAIAAGALA